jgi:transcriptional regulator with XRE-family HTH domain
MPTKKALGEAFRLVRKTAGLSQDDFMLCSSRTFVSAIERGRKSPTVDKLSQLSEFMGTDPAVILLLASMLDELEGAALEGTAKPSVPFTKLNELVARLAIEAGR